MKCERTTHRRLHGNGMRKEQHLEEYMRMKSEGITPRRIYANEMKFIPQIRYMAINK